MTIWVQLFFFEPSGGKSHAPDSIFMVPMANSTFNKTLQTITPANADKSEGGKRSLERELNGWGFFRMTDGDGKIRFSSFEVQYVGLVDIWLIFG